MGRIAGDVRVKRIRQALTEAGHSDIAISRIETSIHRAWKEWDRVWEQEYRTFGAEHWVSLVLADLGVALAGLQREALARTMETSGMELEPPLVNGVSSLLPRLAERYRLGVICDTGLSPGWMLRRWMERHGILRYFAHLTFSDALGVSKPHPEAFLTTLAGLDTRPEAAVHIGDFPRTDIAGAQAVGMRAIRFKGVHDWHAGSVRADADIASYDELEPLLEAWRSSD